VKEEERIAVGRILRPHGLRGELAVEVWSDNPSRFAVGSRLLTDQDEELEVAAARPHKGSLLVCFAGVLDRDGALALRGRRLRVERSAAAELPEDTFYYFELIGCSITDEIEGELGRVVGVVEGGGGELLDVERTHRSGDPPQSRRRVLIPFARAYLLSVDVSERRIQVRLPPGLIAACESKS
jgi:16S rRNA processing protein RimM